MFPALAASAATFTATLNGPVLPGSVTVTDPPGVVVGTDDGNGAITNGATPLPARSITPPGKSRSPTPIDPAAGNKITAVYTQGCALMNAQFDLQGFYMKSLTQNEAANCGADGQSVRSGVGATVFRVPNPQSLTPRCYGPCNQHLDARELWGAACRARPARAFPAPAQADFFRLAAIALGTRQDKRMVALSLNHPQRLSWDVATRGRRERRILRCVPGLFCSDRISPNTTASPRAAQWKCTTSTQKRRL